MYFRDGIHHTHGVRPEHAGGSHKRIPYFIAACTDSYFSMEI